MPTFIFQTLRPWLCNALVGLVFAKLLRGHPFPRLMDGIVEGFLAQSVKILFGWTLIAGLFFAVLMLLWDIPMVRHQIKHIPAWPTVGMRVYRGFIRQRKLKLHRKEKMRRIKN